MKEPYDQIKPLYRKEDLFCVKDDVFVIVGGAGKMGEQFALTLSSSGAKVVLADIDQQKCADLAAKVAEETNGTVVGKGCDASCQDDVRKLFGEVDDQFKKVTGVICNTMAKPKGYYAPFDEYPIETFNKVLAGNLSASFLSVREASRYMREGGTIVLTCSTYGIVGPDQRIYENCKAGSNLYGDEYPLNAPVSYSASKAGLIGLCRYLATLLAKKNIRVNLLTPGGVYDGQEEEFHKEYVRRVPLERMAVWSDYNGAILFLCSPASRYMTGSNLTVDGGWSCW